MTLPSLHRALLACVITFAISQTAAAQGTPSNAEMWEAIQKQQAEIDALRKENQDLKCGRSEKHNMMAMYWMPII